MLERDFERGMRREAKGLFYKFTSPSVAGVPDRVWIEEGRVRFVELKSAKGRLTPIQERRITELVVHGAEVLVVFAGTPTAAAEESARGTGARVVITNDPREAVRLCS